MNTKMSRMVMMAIALSVVFLNLTWAREVLPEGLYLSDLQVTLVDPCDAGAWSLRVESPMKVSEHEIPVGTRWALLPTYALEVIVKSATEHTWRHWQLYGRLTAYQGRQYFYTERGRPIIPPAPEPNEPSVAEPNGLAQAANALGIPEELVKRIDSRPSTRIPVQSLPTADMTDRVLVDRVGRLVHENGQCLFRFESLGRREAGPALRVLPSQIRERMEQMQATGSPGLRFRIAALKTEYRGQTELLLLRAVRVYNLGNFGD